MHHHPLSRVEPAPTARRFLVRLLALLVALSALSTLSACSEEPSVILVDGEDNNQRGDLVVDEAKIVAVRDGETLHIEIPIASRIGLDASGELEVALRDLDGNLIDDVSNSFSLHGGAGVGTASLDGIPADAETGELANYVIHYRVRSFRADLWGRRSVFAAVKKREVHVLSADTFYINAASGLRIIAREPVTGEPLANATVEAHLEVPSVDDPTVVTRQHLFSTSTDAFGVASPTFAAPALPVDGNLVLTFTTISGSEVVSRPIQVVREEKILLTTDKPLYQPGQTIHLRALALSRPSLAPAANQPVLLEVRDGKGNKIFKIETTTNGFGVASADFKLANQLNMGAFKINATVGEAEAEKTVNVERYVLPKYKVELSTDASWYRPGTVLGGTVAANYLFGKPVSGGQVTLVASTFDVGLNVFETITGQLDEAGNMPFAITLPTWFAAGSLDQGHAFVQLDIQVIDDADHTQTVTKQVTIAEGALVLTTIPRTNLVPTQPGSFFVLAADPTGMPAAGATVRLQGSTIDASATTNDAGIAVLSFTTPDLAELQLTFSGADTFGNAASQELTVTLGQSSDDGAIALVTDKALYTVGDPAQIDIFTHADVKRVFIDVIRDGQTLLTSIVEVSAGVAHYEYVVDASSSGTLHFEVYYASAAGNIVRSRKLAFVQAANDLVIEAALDAAEYRPGETASIDFTVTDPSGKGVQAALGISIVDEAVFALQEMQPGLAKIFFRIEEELLEPKYEIHGFQASDLVAAPSSDPAEAEARDEAAAVLMAAVEDVSPYAISVNTLAEALTRSQAITKTAVESDAQRVLERLGQLLDMGIYSDDDAELLAAAVDGSLADPWGHTYEVKASDSTTLSITSAGSDEVFGNEDDVVMKASTWSMRSASKNDTQDPWGNDGVFAGGVDMDGGMEPNAGPPMAEDETRDSSSGGGSDAPRVRRYFPETLYFNPSLITDVDGTASLSLPMADSITTWRLSSMASSANGQLGSGTTPILVFQPFFIDIDFPTTLTQNDELSVPVALYNYLDGPQSVTLRVDDTTGSWYTLLDTPERTVQLAANEVSVEFFRVRVDTVGWHPFRVWAIGTTMSDAIERRIQVKPDGKAFPISVSGRLASDVAERIDVPMDAVTGGTTLVAKVYPGMFSQVVEGLDSLLQMPSGCFEQTSSTTYPNVLALKYMQDTGQSTPEVELKAQEYISLGYQRLVSFEVNGGGFEWFGNDPAHRILTSYGLLEFSDMAKVYPVDEAVISRTQTWLISQQESDGHFRAAPEGIHEGATNNFKDSDLRASAYITYALLYSGYDGAGISSAVSWLKQHASEADDAYTLALIASALLLNDDSDPKATAVIADLAALAKTKPGRSGDLVYWESASQSLYYSTGETMNMETTAMALLALIEAGTYPTLVEGGVNFLVENKDSFGNWSSTQATILSLRVFISMLASATESVDATVRVYAAGQLVETLTVNAFNSDVLQQVDLTPYAVHGANDVQLELDGTGSLLYQLSGEYYLPWSDEIMPPGDVLSIDVAYDRTTMQVNDRVTATVSVSNNSAARQDMILVDLGVPPGFDVISEGLTAAVQSGAISKFELTERQVIVYLYGLDAGATLSFSYEMEARMPLEAQTPPSVAYLYYDPAQKAESAPEAMSVQ